MDNREYRTAVDEFGDMVYRIALNQTRSAADADDVTQAVFLKLYTHPPRDAEGPHLKHWLIRVTVNECRSLWRTLWRRRVELRDITDADGAPLGAALDGPAFSEPGHERLYEALGQLPEKCRIVVHLFYFEDYRTREIADILGIKEPTVRTRLARARKLLKQQLKEAWEDEQSQAVQSHDERRPCSC